VTLPIAGFALHGNEWDGIYLGRRKTYPRKIDHGFDKASAANLRKRLTQDAVAYQAHCAQRHVGRTEVTRRDRIPRQIGGRKSAASVLQALLSASPKMQHQADATHQRDGQISSPPQKPVQPSREK
jgi:hypothetical protein